MKNQNKILQKGILPVNPAQLLLIVLLVTALWSPRAEAISAKFAADEKPQTGTVDTFDVKHERKASYQGEVVDGILHFSGGEKEIVIYEKEVLEPVEATASQSDTQPARVYSAPVANEEAGSVLGVSTMRGSAEESAALFFAGADALIQTINNLAEEIDQVKADLSKLKASTTKQEEVAESLSWLKYLSALALIIVLGFIWHLESRVARITKSAAKTKKTPPSKKKNGAKAKSKSKSNTRRA